MFGKNQSSNKYTVLTSKRKKLLPINDNAQTEDADKLITTELFGTHSHRPMKLVVIYLFYFFNDYRFKYLNV